MSTGYTALASSGIQPSAAAVSLGWSPIAIQPVFSLGQDWVVTLSPSVATSDVLWPVGTVVTAFVYQSGTQVSNSSPWPTPLATWVASITGNDVSFVGPSAECDSLAAGSVMRIQVVLPSSTAGSGSASFNWGIGLVVRDD